MPWWYSISSISFPLQFNSQRWVRDIFPLKVHVSHLQSLHESSTHARSIETRKHSDQEESGGLIRSKRLWVARLDYICGMPGCLGGECFEAFDDSSRIWHSARFPHTSGRSLYPTISFDLFTLAVTTSDPLPSLANSQIIQMGKKINKNDR